MHKKHAAKEIFQSIVNILIQLTFQQNGSCERNCWNCCIKNKHY